MCTTMADGHPLLSCHTRQETKLPPTLEEERMFEVADCLFRGAPISVLANNIMDVYIHMPMGKEIWDALETKFGVFDVDCGLYLMVHSTSVL